MNNSEKEFELGLPSIGIPSEVLFNPFLTATEQKLFGFIRNLSQSKRGCWATNNYLASLFIPKLTSQTISNGIAKLKKYAYINVEYLKQTTQKGIVKERRVYINNDYPKLYRPIVELIHQELFSNQNNSISLDGIYKYLYTYIKNIIYAYKKTYNIEDGIEAGIEFEKNFINKIKDSNESLKKKTKLTRKIEKLKPKKRTSPEPIYKTDSLFDYPEKVQTLFNHWLSLKIVQHKGETKTKKKALKLLTNKATHYPESEIKKAMDNYKKLLNDKFSILYKTQEQGLPNFISPDSYGRKFLDNHKLENSKSLFDECLKDDLSHLMITRKDEHPELTQKIKQLYLDKINDIKVTSKEESVFRKTSSLLTEFWNKHKKDFNLHISENRNVDQFLPIFIESVKDLYTNGNGYPGLMSWSLEEKSGPKFYYWLKERNYFRSKTSHFEANNYSNQRANLFDCDPEY